MSDVRVQIRLDSGAINAVVGGQVSEAVQQAAEVTRQRMVSRIRALGLVDTGALAASIRTVPVQRSALQPAVAIGSPLDYAAYLEHGTRGHGPSRAKVLRFKPKGSGKFVYARWVRGVRAYKFVESTLREVQVSDYL